jgi:hypothetical protein
MIKIQARIDGKEWDKLKRRLGAKSNQEAIAFLIRSQLQRWAKADKDLNDRLSRFNERAKSWTKEEGEE